MKITIRLLSTSVVCDNPTFAEWLKVVNQSVMGRVRAPWIIGDLMNYGEAKFQERHAQALDECVIQYHTMQNWRWVSRRFEPSRRRKSLSWSHHETVARLPEKEQDIWLDMAEGSRLSVHDLRQQVKGKFGDDPVVVDKRYAEDFQRWKEDTTLRAALLRAINQGSVEIVGFDKKRQMPIVKTKAKAA